MTKDAKRAAKLEKKLKILLGGYQVLFQESYSMTINQHTQMFVFDKYSLSESTNSNW
jgi:hypothetical protein